MRTLLATFSLLLAVLSCPAHAGDASGKNSNMVVGRMGHQVLVHLTNVTFNNFPCNGGTPPAVFQFAFSTAASGGKDMLAALLAAKAMDRTIQLVGTGTCTVVDSTMEDVMYVWLY
jgi:hypothetical protein